MTRNSHRFSVQNQSKLDPRDPPLNRAPGQGIDGPAQDAVEVVNAAPETANPQPMPVEPVVGDSTTPAETPSEAPQAEASAQEEELICRSIRLDMSSRRKTRVCRTEEGWRQLNQQR